MEILFESLLLAGLRKSTAHIIRPEQFAFMRKHSTTNRLTKLVDDLVISFNKKERTVAVLLDYEKTFDKTGIKDYYLN